MKCQEGAQPAARAAARTQRGTHELSCGQRCPLLPKALEKVFTITSHYPLLFLARRAFTLWPHIYLCFRCVQVWCKSLLLCLAASTAVWDQGRWQDLALGEGSPLGCSPGQRKEEVFLDVLGAGTETPKLFFQWVRICQAELWPGPDASHAGDGDCLSIKRQRQAWSLG